MNLKRVLIVDDEKNIRLTLSRALEALELEIDTAVNGEQALDKLAARPTDLILLDLKMPGMDGMEVLRRIKDAHARIKTIIITAHGTIDSAVEAMKLGAVDYLQKPFSPNDIRELVQEVLAREELVEPKKPDYAALFELAKRAITERRFQEAAGYCRRAIDLNALRPEAFNLLGALAELEGDKDEAARNYHQAFSLNPLYSPSTANWFRLLKRVEDTGAIALDEEDGLR